MKKVARAVRTKKGIAIVIGVALLVGGLAFLLLNMGGEDPTELSDGGTEPIVGEERSLAQLSAEMDLLRQGVQDNRKGTNAATDAVNEIHLVLDGQAEQVAAMLQRQQTVNPAVLEVQLEQLAETVREMSLILGQTRRQTQEITEIGGAVSTLQRRMQAVTAEAETINEHISALEDRIIQTQRIAEQNAALLADPTIFVKPELTIDWDMIGTPEALGLCRNSQLWAHRPPSVPGQEFSLDMSTQIAMYYRNEMNEGRLTENQARDLLAACREDIGQGEAESQ